MSIPNYWDDLIGKDSVSELFDIDVDRADLVSSPAIRRKFLLVKSDEDAHDTNTTQEDEMELIEVLKGLIAKAENADFAVEAVAALDRLQKSADEDGANGLLDELKSAFGDSDTITKEQFEAWQTKAEALAVEEVEDEETPEPEIEEEEDVAKSETDDEEDEEEGEVIEKSLTEKIEKQAAELKLAKADFKKAQKEIETLRIEKQRKELVEKASSELCNLGKSADEVGDLLMSFRQAGVPEEVFDGLYDLLKSNSEMIKQSGFFNEFGTSVEPDASDPEVKMMNEAKKLAKNGDFETVPQAYAHLYKSAEKE